MATTYSITSADFDDDGTQDVAVACGDWRSAFVFLNEGGGTLGEPATTAYVLFNDGEGSFGNRCVP